ncbi:MAG: mechanosensitive ion channel family protein [Nitrospiria bacterium]
MLGTSLEDLKTLLLKITVEFAQSGLRILLIVIGGYLGVRVGGFLLRRLEEILVKARERTETVPGSTKKRVTTLVTILGTILRFGIWTIVFVMALDQIGVNVGPIIAGAGIAGLAVGFGAQNLVKDLISGFFIILEDQIHIGDVAIINGTGGLVESISFRTIVLRDLAGVVHIFPNGSVNTLSNMTKNWSAYVINMGVAYKEDTDRVVEVMRQVADELREDPEYKDKILQPIEIFGVDDFGASEVTIKARLKTLPIQQWSVGREYRRRLKKAFDAHGIEIPFPHHSLYIGESTKPLEILLKQVKGETS